jgi:glucose/arabinose dehydrogenase
MTAARRDARAVRWIGAAIAAAAVLVGAIVLIRGARRSRRDAEGQAAFRVRCAVCHSIDLRVGQGPGLGGVVGRIAGSAPGFRYTTALRESHLVWTTATLDRFLSGPAAMVPGTTMPITVEDDRERDAIVAYLATLAAVQGSPDAAATTTAPSTQGAAGSWRDDAPGRRHRIALADLPAPFASPSAHNGPSTVDRPAGAVPAVPAGFTAAVFASGLENPRNIRVAPNGDVFVAEMAPGRLRVLRLKDGAAAPDRVEVFAEGLDHPFGIAFFPSGDDPQWLYVANVNSIVRFPYRSGDLHAQSPAQAVVPRLTEKQSGHTTRDIAFSRDGRTMFVSIGSATNVDEGAPRRAPAENAAWDEAHGVGAEWGTEMNRADVLAFDPEGSDGHVFATGIRNCVSMAVDASGDLYCSTNERDGLGDDLVPDFVSRVPARSFFGWPWYYLGQHEDPRHAGERPDLVDHVTLPDLLLQSHSAPLEMTFYDGGAFPPEYRGDAFIACHGSWNRAARTGPKVVRVFMRGDDGGRAPTGDYEDFMTGFVVDDEHVWGRPVGVAVVHDGSLLVSEDANGTIWRVAFTGSTRGP